MFGTFNRQTIRPRRPDEPQVDLTVFRLVHRAMVTDLARLSVLTAALANGEARCDRKRASALRDYLDQLLLGIRHHHHSEEEIHWPLITTVAGKPANLEHSAAEHVELDRLMARTRHLADRLAAAPAQHGICRDLAAAIAELKIALEKHIPDEERDVFPLISQYVRIEDFRRADQEVLKQLSPKQLPFVLPFLARFASAMELEVAMRAAGSIYRVLLLLTRPFYARQERAVFG